MIQMEPEHLSLYLLNLEERSKIAKRSQWKDWLIEKEEDLTNWYLKGVERLNQAGLMQYEVSNFAKPGFESLQNLSNWKRKNYLGLGQGAHGMVGQVRYGNHRQWSKYEKALKGDCSSYAYIDHLSINEVREEELMIGLRQVKGLAYSWFKKVFKGDEKSLKKILNTLLEEDLAEFNGGFYRLKSGGLLIADEATAWLASKILD